MTIALVVVGARGRLGSLVIREAGADPRFSVVAEIARGDDLAAALVRAPRPVVVIDVATPGQSAERARVCAQHGAALLVATTGLSDEEKAALHDAAARIPVLVAANLSVGAHLAAALVARAAGALPQADVEVVETHHRKKQDAPSGTAWMLARAAEEGRAPASRIVTSRSGLAPRQAGEIGISAVRGGDVVGEHVVTLFVDGERIEIAHRVTDRAIFARGALVAAVSLSTRAAGAVSMRDVLGL